MNIRQLIIFRAVCEDSHLTNAAKRLYMTQPAVSQSIRELEEELGYPLFDRISHRLCLTGAGQLFLEKAIRLLELYQELEQSRDTFPKHAPLRLGSSITIANERLPGILQAFAEEYPDVPLKVTVDNAREIEQKLLGNEIDLAYLEGVPSSAQLTLIPFASHKLILLCGPSYIHGSQLPLSPAALNAERLLLREQGSAIRDAFDSAMLLLGLNVEPCYTSVNSQALLAAARKNLGITVLPESIAADDLREGTLIRLLVTGLELKNPCHIAYHRDKSHSEAFDYLVQAALHSS